MDPLGVSPPTPPGQGDAAPGSGASTPWSAHLEELGQLLRRSRESQGLTAETVADRLRIGVEQLQALETADQERLPEAVFVIAQARRVAGALKLDIEPQLAALRANPNGGPARARTPVNAAALPPPERRANASARPRGLLSLLAVLLAAAAGWGLWRQFGPTAPAAGPSVSQGSVQPPTAPPSRPQPAARQPRPASGLVLDSAQASWVQVRQPDGTTLFKGLLQGSRSFPGSQGLEVLAGRPDLVRAQWQGSPPQPLGSISDVRWRRFAPQR
ncbi:MAG: RodZ domain-containing protein [Synechococcus sp. ELA057]